MKNIKLWYLAPLISIVSLIFALTFEKSGYSALLSFIGAIASFIGYLAIRKNKREKPLAKILLGYFVGFILLIIISLLLILWVASLL